MLVALLDQNANPVTQETGINNIKNFSLYYILDYISLYLTRNMLHLHYDHELVNGECRNRPRLFWQSYET
jgi:hypothetical protein